MPMTLVEVFASERFVVDYAFESADEEDVRRFLDRSVSRGFIHDWDEARAYEGGPDACNGEPSYVLTK